MRHCAPRRRSAQFRLASRASRAESHPGKRSCFATRKKSQPLLKDGWQLFIGAITQGNRYRGPGLARHDSPFPTDGRVSHSAVATEWLRQHSIVGGTPAVPRRNRGHRGLMQGDWRRVDGPRSEPNPSRKRLKVLPVAWPRGRSTPTHTPTTPGVQCAPCSDSLGRAVAAEPRGDHGKLKASELPY